MKAFLNTLNHRQTYIMLGVIFSYFLCFIYDSIEMINFVGLIHIVIFLYYMIVSNSILLYILNFCIKPKSHKIVVNGKLWIVSELNDYTLDGFSLRTIGKDSIHIYTYDTYNTNMKLYCEQKIKSTLF